MLIACWSAKGGAGTTVIAAALSLLLGRRTPGGALLVDLAGDVPAALGMPEPDGPGLSGWIEAGDEVPPDALARLEIRATPQLTILPRGSGDLSGGRDDVLAALLGADSRPVVVDCGVEPDGVARTIAAGAVRSVLVTRPCFLALRRASNATLHPSEVILVSEPGRGLRRYDVEAVLGAPIVAEVPVDPVVARAVDAGLLAGRLPRSLERELRDAA